MMLPTRIFVCRTSSTISFPLSQEVISRSRIFGLYTDAVQWTRRVRNLGISWTCFLLTTDSYVCFDNSGTQIWGWRNGANANGPPAYWYKMRGVASGLPSLDLAGWKFADLNGDHRDDLVSFSLNSQPSRFQVAKIWCLALGQSKHWAR